MYGYMQRIFLTSRHRTQSHMNNFITLEINRRSLGEGLRLDPTTKIVQIILKRVECMIWPENNGFGQSICSMSGFMISDRYCHSYTSLKYLSQPGSNHLRNFIL